MFLNNYLLDENENATPNVLDANFNNCIIYGNDNPEIILDENDGADFGFKFTNCLIRFQDNNNNFPGDNYNLSNSELYDNCIFNSDPDFKLPFENDLRIGEDSGANNLGNDLYDFFAAQVPVDILNTNRTTSPDLGAYQHIIFEED